MKKDNRTLIIIPTFNERGNIGRLLEELLARAEECDILVIDDNSPDGTADIVKGAATSVDRLNLISREAKMGLGTAYLLGFQWAIEREYSSVLTMDADFSHQPGYLSGMINDLDTYDMVVGSRYTEGGCISGWPLRRKLLSDLGNKYMRLITGLPIRDCTSGFTGIRKEMVREILAGNIISEGYAFLIETKHLVWRKGGRIREFPIRFVDRVAGRSKISRKIIFEAVVLVWKLLFRFGRAVQKEQTRGDRA